MALGSTNAPGISGRDAAEAKKLASAANENANAAKTAAENAVTQAGAAKTAAENAAAAAASANSAASAAQTAASKAAEDMEKINQAIEDNGGSIGGGGGNVIKITFEEAFVGQTYTVTDGDEPPRTGTVPEGLVVSVNVANCNSTYTIKATASNGVEYSTSVTTGAYYGQYTASLAVFNATINVTAVAGAEVKATKGSEVFTAIAGTNGVAAVRVNQTGTYTITGTKDDASSNSASVNVTGEQTYTATIKFIRLTVKTPAGSKLVLKNGTAAFKEVASTTGTEVFYLPNTGTYNGEISKDGETATGSINCTAYQDYTLDIAFVHIYGASWDGTSTTKWSRTDESAGFTDPVPAINNGNGNSPFDSLQPWAGMVKSERTGGTMVAIPKFWYKITQNGKGMKIQIADRATAGFSVSPAHMDRGDGKGERDVVYVGRYHCGASNYKSVTGQKPKVNITRSAARSGIHALGSNIWQMDFAMRFTIWLLYIVEFADWNTQKTIGGGCSETTSSSSAVFNMGKTDGMTYHTGTVSNAHTAYGVCQYRWIEGLWDNCYDWMDGCYYNSSGLNIILNPNSFSDSSGGTAAGVPSNGWPSAFTVKTVAGMALFYPTEANGSEATYSCDNWGFSAGYPCLYTGGYYFQSTYRGLFYVSCNGTSDSSDYIGARLQELP